MEYRQLGSSGLRVSTLTLGASSFGGSSAQGDLTKADLASAQRRVDMSLDIGINLVDTADVYNSGRSEELVGRALRGKRDKMLISSKVRMPTGTGPNDAGLSRHHVIEACEASLRRLGTDHIDLYHVHAWDATVSPEELLGALQYLIDTGKVRYVGVSNYAAWQLMKTLGVADRANLPRFVCHQIYYSLQERSAEYELIPLAIDQGLGTVVWSPLARGLLSGKYRRETHGPGAFADWWLPPVYDEELLHSTVDVLQEIADTHDASISQVALAWLLGRPSVASVLVGGSTDEQVVENVEASELHLLEDQRARLEEVSRPRLIYPYWHQKATVPDRLGPADRTLLGPYLKHVTADA